MFNIKSRILFDRRDHALIAIVNEVLNKDRSLTYTKKLFYPYFHPHGIKEMAESKGLRIAYAVVHLLASLEDGKVDDRLVALRSLRDEVLSAAGGSMPKNTARVLIQIMKELVRAHGDYHRQLELAHDFRTATSGKPRMIRRLLRRYHLLEMPEEWNQLAFDDHVHDVNTKGRKSATHLIMDAWIKGIRRLRVIYYYHIQPKNAAELLEAAQIMGIDVRIGIEFSGRYRGKYVHLIWVPRGFPDPQAFLCFLAEPSVMELMSEGKEVVAYQQAYVMAILEEFNRTHRETINEEWGIHLENIEPHQFQKFVGSGQASILHLAQYIFNQIAYQLQAKLELEKKRYVSATPEEKKQIEDLVKRMNELDWETIAETYLTPEKNPSIINPSVPNELPDTPKLLKLSPEQIVNRLASLHSGYRITLNLSNLKVEDVLELIYNCNGTISRLEMFNLKDHSAGKTDHYHDINLLQQAINTGNVITLKKIIRYVIEKVRQSDYPDREDRIQKLTAILHDIGALKEMYKGIRIKSRIGSDSTGRSRRVPGMGLVMKESLPVRAQKEIEQSKTSSYEYIPIHITAYPRITYIPHENIHPSLSKIIHRLYHKPGLRLFCQSLKKDWEFQEDSTRMTQRGNIVTMSSIQREQTQLFRLVDPTPHKKRQRISWRYLNTGLKNSLKVILGFIPAFTSFYLTSDWWVLAYFGAFIWFGITGLRNILQSVLGGGGFRRSRLLRWNDYVSWERLTDSLLFTGFSVPLLDYFVKTLILKNTFHITVATNPTILYTCIAIFNGIYISGHNIIRGFSTGVIIGNFFRTAISIPIAIGFNLIIGQMLSHFGVLNVNDVLQKWAAVISKTSSDCVAGIIEGIGDRYTNVQMRIRDYESKLSNLFNGYSMLEMMFPDIQAQDLLNPVDSMKYRLSIEAQDMIKIIMIHSLDLMYFWMYQPRARIALQMIMQNRSAEEREIFVQSQFVLKRHKDIAQLFIDGILGNNFMKALAFYLDRSEDYLKDIQKLI